MGVLTPSWLLGPCPLLAQQPLQFRLGRQRQEWQLSPLWGYATFRLPQRPPPGQQGDGPLPFSVPLVGGRAGGPHPRGLYIHFVSPHLPCCMHVIFYSQSIALPPIASALPLPAGVVGG